MVFKERESTAFLNVKAAYNNVLSDIFINQLIELGISRNIYIEFTSRI